MIGPMESAPALTGPKQRLAGALGAACAALAIGCVQHFEGRRHEVYLDPVAIPTVCDGITGRDVRLGDAPRTDAQCDDLLVQRLQAIDAAIEPCVHRPMTPGEHAAFLSFSYNAGPQRFCHSTMVRKFNAGDAAGACAELSKWIYAGPNVLPGLVKRRAEERRMCEGRVS
jgi:lysozyme